MPGMRGVSTIELAAIVSELQSVKGFYLEKFYEAGNGEFRIKIKNREKYLNIKSMLGKSLNITKYIEKADQPTNFAIAVRKRIEGSVIESVEQYNNDRVAIFRLRKGEGRSNLIFELFGKGNLVLTDENMLIDIAYIYHEFKDRSVMHGKEYKAPENTPITMANMDALSNFLASIPKEDPRGRRSAVSVLSTTVNIGALYVENMLNELGIDPKSNYSALPTARTKDIEGLAVKLLGYIKNPKPRIYRDESYVDYAICDIIKYSALTKTELGSMSEMLDESDYATTDMFEKHENKELIELSGSIEKQKRILEEALPGVSDAKEAGEKLIRNMNLVNEIIFKARSNKHISVKELQDEFPDTIIKDIDLKNKTVTLEL
jgi:predicted ribosome quality control (RQC) complex YloA/Tae2 family protein